MLAREHFAAGRMRDAAHVVVSCLRTMRRRGSTLFVAMYIGLSIPVLIDAANTTSAVRLLGAFSQTPPAHYPTVRPLIETWRTALATHLEPSELDTLVADGATLPLETAAALAQTALQHLVA